MSISARKSFAFVAALSVVSTVSSPSFVGPSVQALLKNDMYGEQSKAETEATRLSTRRGYACDESPREDAFLVPDASKTYEDAVTACLAFGEAFRSPTLGLSNDDGNFPKYPS